MKRDIMRENNSVGWGKGTYFKAGNQGKTSEKVTFNVRANS